MSEANVDVPARTAGPTMPPFRTTRRLRAIQGPQYPSLHRYEAIGSASRADAAVFAQSAILQPAIALPSPAPSRGAYRLVGKRALDVALVILAAPLALLLIGIAALLLWIEGGSPFYRQARLGKGGNRFSIFKLRTMVRDADRLLEVHLAADPALRAEWDKTQKLRHDPRITPIGEFLRKTSLDELPQLWNVLRGDMSLVGPRPMLPEQLSLYGNATHYFAQRPGITGYWQVSQRNNSAFRARAALDAAYDFDVSLIEDAKVLWRTIGAVVKRTGY